MGFTVIGNRQDGVARVAAKWRRSSLALRVSWLAAAVPAVWFLINMLHPVGPAVLLWAGNPVAALAGTVIFWQTSRNPALPRPARLFWRRLTPVAPLVGVGQIAQAIRALRSPAAEAAQPGQVMLVCGGIVIVIILYALYRVPTGRSDRSDTLRVTLDAGTVMLATAVFIWHFGTSAELEAAGGETTFGALTLIVLASFVVFTMMKILLSNYAVIDSPGVGLLVAAILWGSLETMFQPLLAGFGGRLVVTQVGIPLIYLFVAEAADRQATASLGMRPDSVRKRTFVVFPYVAVACVDGLLIWVACFDVTDIVTVAAGAVALTAFVVMRQILALVANQKLVHQLDHGANHDPLTGLPNRSYYNRRLHQALANPDQGSVTLALIDLDDFKMVNDTLGHEMGDVLLVEVARRLRGCVRAADTVARLGGDEFVVLLERAEPDDLAEIVDRMLSALSEPVQTEGNELPVRASIGIADGRSGHDPSVLLRQADMAMYAAKELPGTAALHYDDDIAAGFLAKPERAGGRPVRTR